MPIVSSLHSPNDPTCRDVSVVFVGGSRAYLRSAEADVVSSVPPGPVGNGRDRLVTGALLARPRRSPARRRSRRWRRWPGRRFSLSISPKSASSKRKRVVVATATMASTRAARVRRSEEVIDVPEGVLFQPREAWPRRGLEKTPACEAGGRELDKSVGSAAEFVVQAKTEDVEPIVENRGLSNRVRARARYSCPHRRRDTLLLRSSCE